MKANADQIIHGLMQFADNEVIAHLPTSGKWLLGTGLGVATTKANDIIYALSENALIHSMGIIDEKGNYDIDLVMDNLKASAKKYGKLYIDLPFVGNMTFNENDIDKLKQYIERG